MIAIATYIYVLFQAAVALVMSRNKYYHDWYVQVLLLLSLPAYYAIYNFTAYILKDGLQTREKLGWSCLMIMLSEVLQGIFKIIYITYCYKYDVVFIGHGHPENSYQAGRKPEGAYIVQSKRENIYGNIIVMIAVCFIYGIWMVYCDIFAASYTKRSNLTLLRKNGEKSVKFNLDQNLIY